MRPVRVLALMESGSVSGPAKNLIACAGALARMGAAGAEVRVATFLRSGTGNEFTKACEQAGLTVETIAERRALDPGVIPQLRAVAERFQPDIVQSHHIKSHVLVRLSGINRRAPWIAFNHGYTAENLKMKLYNQADRWSLPAADRVVVVCEAFAAEMKRRGIRPERLAVRHNAVSEMAETPPQVVRDLREKLGIPADARVLLTVGRLSAEKAQAVLLRAAAVLKQRGQSGFRVILVGDGLEREHLKTLCAELGIEDLAILAGSTRNVAPYYALADIFALPSDSEGSPNVLLEAMMAGLPVVATAVGGVPEIVEPDANGLLVPARDPNAMAHAIAGLLEDAARCRALGERARECVRRLYSREAYVASILALYESTLAVRGSK